MYVYVYQKSKSGKLNFGHVKFTLGGGKTTITSMQHVFFTKAFLMGRQCHISSRNGLTASFLMCFLSLQCTPPPQEAPLRPPAGSLTGCAIPSGQ